MTLSTWAKPLSKKNGAHVVKRGVTNCCWGCHQSLFSIGSFLMLWIQQPCMGYTPPSLTATMEKRFPCNHLRHGNPFRDQLTLRRQSHLISSHLIPSHPISSHLLSSRLVSSHLISSHLTPVDLYFGSIAVGSRRSTAPATRWGIPLRSP